MPTYVFAHPVAEQRRILGHNGPIPVARPHGRTFVDVQGVVTESAGNRRNTRLAAWTEWEAHAHTSGAAPLPTMQRHDPTLVARPYVQGPLDRSVHNTDPLVFDGPFVYNLCRQQHFPTMRTLERGDVVVFGGHSGEGFLLDTVFVVGSVRRYDVAMRQPTPTAQHVSIDTLLRTLDPSDDPLTCCPPGPNCHRHAGLTLADLRWYDGATPDDPVDGMYSFVPALPHNGTPRSFRRPNASIIPGIGNPMALGIRHEVDARATWDAIVAHVRDLGLALATRLDTWPSASDAEHAASARV